MNLIIIKLASLLLKLFSFTLRMKHHHAPIDEIVKKSGATNYTVAIWHNDLLNSFISFRKGKYAVMVSQSKDGEIATTIGESCSKFKFVRGSASRGAKRALLQLIKLMKNDGIPGVLTVDGPRGPRHVVKPGIIELAKLTDSCILPVICYPKRHHIFTKSWDKFRLAKPFTTIHVDIGNPITIPAELHKDDYQSICDQIRDELHNTEKRLLESIPA